MPQTYDSKHQSHNNDYDDEVGSKTSPICLALLAGISLKKMTLTVYEKEHIGEGEDFFDCLFNHHIEDIPLLPSKSNSDGHHYFQSSNSDGYNGSNSYLHWPWQPYPSVHSSHSPQSQGQNKQGDL
jgi:hypothetical protein